MNKKITKQFYKYYHRWVLPFVIDKGDNLLESEGQLHLLIADAIKEDRKKIKLNKSDVIGI